MTKIDIISGFLGAGKTTMIKKLIKDVWKDEKLVLIENEFGEIGIDGGFLKDAGIEIREMNSGCICCSLVGDFSEALKKVLQEYAPDRIVIEPSGVGKLSDVIRAVEGVAKEEEAVRMNSFTTVADALKCRMYMKNFGEFFNNQLAYAKTIVLSRTQKLSEEKLETVAAEIKGCNEQASLITTPWEQLDGKEILAVMEQADDLAKELLEETEVCPHCGHVHEHHHEEGGCCHHHEHGEHHEHHEGCGCGHHHEHHHADDVFTSFGQETVRRYTKAELQHILEELSGSDAYGTILRAKGMLEGTDGEWMYFDLVPQEYEIRKGAPSYTGRFCVIGSSLQTSGLKKLFAGER